MSSLLDEARRLTCRCDANHDERCVTELQPRIVAALEAAERLVGIEYVAVDDSVPDSLLWAPNINALVAALRGE